MTTRLLAAQAELHFQACLHTTVPLHETLVDALCAAERVPLELATVLEDIGQAYCRLADRLSAELKRRGELARERDPDDTGEARIDTFVDALVARLGRIEFNDGTQIDGRRAVESFPVATDAIRTALLIEAANRSRQRAA